MTPSEAIDLRGKVALVTGSARRVGKSIALELASHGMRLIIHHGSSPEDAAAAVAEIQAAGGEAFAHQADLRDPDAIRGLFDQVRAAFGQLDLLVNSAATFQRVPVLDVTLDQWRDVLDVNLTAPFLCSQAAAPLLRESHGCIVNILDLSAFRPWKAFPVHSVSKAGLKMLTEVLALSLGPEVRVNAIAPGPVLRDKGNSPERWQQIGARLPVGHTGDPADVARAVAFLAAQPFITGTVLRVDGGEALLGG